MRIETHTNKEVFQELVQELSHSLYHHHATNILLSAETIHDSFEIGFTVRENNKLSASVCIINNTDLFYQNKRACCFSHYECSDNLTTSQYLLQHAINYCKQKGYSYLLGPMNGSTWNSYRFALEPMTDNIFTEPYHQPYYVNQLEHIGFQTAATYVTQLDSVLKPFEMHVQLDPSITFRTLCMQQYEAELKTIFQFCSTIFQNNFLYTTIEEQNFLNKYLALKDVLQPELILLAEHQGELVGLLLAIHDYHCKFEKRLILKTIGRKRGKQYAGVAHELGLRMLQTAQTQKYQHILHAFMHQRNTSKNLSRKFSGEPFRSYKLFYLAL